MNEEQIQEIDKHICIIEQTVKMLEPTGTNPLVRETVFGATAKMSDILAGEGVEKKPEVKKPPVLFFDLAARRICRSDEDTLEQYTAHDGYVRIVGRESGYKWVDA